MGILSALAIPALMSTQEIGKVSNAAKQGKTTKQLFNSAINVGKYFAIPAALALLAPASIATATVLSVAGNFVLPGLIPDLDVSKDENHKLSVDG